MSGYCNYCGTALPAAAGFCPSCGKAVPRAGAFGQVPPPQYAAAPPPRQPLNIPPGVSYGGYSSASTGYGSTQNLSAIDWMLLPLKRYADFSGRSQRQEYWMFYLLNVIVLTVIVILSLAGLPWSEMQSNPDAQPGPMLFIGIGLGVLWVLGTLVPNIAVAVRRFHDQDQSGWMYMLSFIPYVGSFVLLIFMCFDGTAGPNRFGPDPKGRGAGDIFA